MADKELQRASMLERIERQIQKESGHMAFLIAQSRDAGHTTNNPGIEVCRIRQEHLNTMVHEVRSEPLATLPEFLRDLVQKRISSLRQQQASRYRASCSREIDALATMAILE